jgi:hypothetical protein
MLLFLKFVVPKGITRSLNTSDLTDHNKIDPINTTSQSSTQLSEKKLKASMGSEEKNHLMKSKDVEMKSQQIIEEKQPIKNLLDNEKSVIKKRGKSLEPQIDNKKKESKT